jgi:hypothetical protein
VPDRSAPADRGHPLTPPGYTRTSGANGEVTLARSAPFDWRVVPIVLAGVTAVLPAMLGLLGQTDAATISGFLFSLAMAMAFAFVTVAYADTPTLLVVSDRIVVGERGPNGELLVRVDGRLWPAGEGTDVLLTDRFVTPKNGSSYRAYGVLLVLPDAFAEFDFGRYGEDARQFQTVLCEALQRQPVETPFSPPDEEEADVLPIFVGIASSCLGGAAFVVPGMLGHARIGALAGGACAAAVGWASSLAIRAMLGKNGPHLLHEARTFAARQRT